MKLPKILSTVGLSLLVSSSVTGGETTEERNKEKSLDASVARAKTNSSETTFSFGDDSKDILLRINSQKGIDVLLKELEIKEFKHGIKVSGKKIYCNKNEVEKISIIEDVTRLVVSVGNEKYVYQYDLKNKKYYFIEDSKEKQNDLKRESLLERNGLDTGEVFIFPEFSNLSRNIYTTESVENFLKEIGASFNFDTGYYILNGRNGELIKLPENIQSIHITDKTGTKDEGKSFRVIVSIQHGGLSGQHEWVVEEGGYYKWKREE